MPGGLQYIAVTECECNEEVFCLAVFALFWIDSMDSLLKGFVFLQLQVACVCINCGANMGEYLCVVCRLHDDDIDSNVTNKKMEQPR